MKSTAAHTNNNIFGPAVDISQHLTRRVFTTSPRLPLVSDNINHQSRCWVPYLYSFKQGVAFNQSRPKMLYHILNTGSFGLVSAREWWPTVQAGKNLISLLLGGKDKVIATSLLHCRKGCPWKPHDSHLHPFCSWKKTFFLLEPYNPFFSQRTTTIHIVLSSWRH